MQDVALVHYVARVILWISFVQDTQCSIYTCLNKKINCVCFTVYMESRSYTVCSHCLKRTCVRNIKIGVQLEVLLHNYTSEKLHLFLTIFYLCFNFS